ncbi:PspA/IM30 family protein [Microbacterium sp. NIBRBAC000506063]|nr:PspA/IM30 family protein [Microbacterium sp. NIBRBAC000506063]
MRARWVIAIGIVWAFLAPGWAATAAPATDPGPLSPGTYITDVSDVLTPAQEAAGDERLAQLARDTGVDLFLVFVPEFTTPANDRAWVSETAERNGLADHQYLIGIATDARMFAINGADGLLSAADRTKVTNAMLPSLGNDDWAGAINAAAAEIQDILIDGPARDARTWAIIGIVVAVAVAVIVVVLLLRRARRRAAEHAKRESEIAELAQQANIALVRTDDLVRSSEQELEYARAQFGDEVIAEFVTALATARTDLNEAFSLKQKLDDEIPDSDQERRDWNTRILALCSESTESLEERKADFDELRELEQSAPAALENVRALRAAAGAEIDRADQILARLTAAYVPAAISAVADNPAQARVRMSFTDEQIHAADDAIVEGRTGDAAVSIRAAEGAVQQATQLEDAVEHLANDLKDAEDRSAALVADLQQDLQTAAALPDADGAVAQAIDATRQHLARAQAMLGDTGRDPVEALRILEAANTSIDQIVQRVRDEQAKIAHARSLLAGALQRADTQLSAAESFILNRRGAVESRARTRLAEARSSRDEAGRLAEADPVRALTLAQRADALASEALRQAQYDVGSWAAADPGAAAARTTRSAPCSAASSSADPPAAAAEAAAGKQRRRPLRQFRQQPLQLQRRRLLRRRLRRRRRTIQLGRRRALQLQRRPLLTTRLNDNRIRPRKEPTMAKQSIFGRISTLVRANINALIDSAEDPQKMIDQLVRDYTNSIADAEAAIAETIGNLRLLERDHEEDVQSAREWGNKALAASKKADELRTSGNTADADKFDSLAKIALQRQISAEREATSAEPTIAAQTEVVDKLKDGLNTMKVKLEELKSKRSELLSRAKVAEAQTKVQDAISSINVLDPTSELGRFEDKVRRQEALAQGKIELAASSLDAQFESLEDLGELTEVEARLAELKAGGPTQAAIED